MRPGYQNRKGPDDTSVAIRCLGTLEDSASIAKVPGPRVAHLVFSPYPRTGQCVAIRGYFAQFNPFRVEILRIYSTRLEQRTLPPSRATLHIYFHNLG